jgi:Protein of unknown function (DUF3501)
MRPLTLDDLLPLEEYAARRREFFESHQRFLDRHRRVRIGPRLTLIFENRQTLWFRIQEVLRVARLTDAAHVQPELDLYNRLLPGPDRLQAALLIDVDETRWTEELAAWQTLRGEELRLRVGVRHFPADLLTCRPEDRCFGTAQWVQFLIPDGQWQALCDARQAVSFAVLNPGYRHESLPLSEDIRQSLYDDLEASARAS